MGGGTLKHSETLCRGGTEVFMEVEDNGTGFVRLVKDSGVWIGVAMVIKNLGVGTDVILKVDVVGTTELFMVVKEVGTTKLFTVVKEVGTGIFVKEVGTGIFVFVYNS